MGIRRFAGSQANKILNKIGLEIAPVQIDFNARIVSETHLDRIFETMSKIASDYLFSQVIVKLNNQFNIEEEIRRFYAEFLKSPFRRRKGGSRFGNLLWLDLLAKSAGPDLIVDSGTYMGGSAWALAQGAPDARILSFDIDMSHLALKCPNVEYFEHDWTTFDYGGIKRNNSLCYFDDHLDQVRRLREAGVRGFQVAIFDDDFSALEFVSMAHGGIALPKISFVLDDSLRDGEVIRWMDGTRSFEWKVNRAQLEAARNLIGAVDRLPNLAAVCGFDQLPYRIVAIKRVASDISRPMMTEMGR